VSEEQLVRSVINVIHTVFTLYSLALILRVFLEMLVGAYQPVVVFLRRITEPLLAPIRRVVRPVQAGSGYVDLSPIVAVVILWVVEQILTRVLVALVL
jgi:YggT family protein